MFNFISDAIENTLDIADGLISGDDISKKQIAKLISDGLSVYAIASATGLAVDVIEKYLEE